MDLVNQIVSNIPVETVLQVLAAAGVIAMVIQKLKSWLSLQSSGVINFVNGVLSFSVVAVEYLTNAITASPVQLPTKSLALMSVVTAVYHFPYVGIKALSQLAKDVKETKARKARLAETTPTEELVPTEVPIETVVPQVTPDEVVAIAPVVPDEFAA